MPRRNHPQFNFSADCGRSNVHLFPVRWWEQDPLSLWSNSKLNVRENKGEKNWYINGSDRLLTHTRISREKEKKQLTMRNRGFPLFFSFGLGGCIFVSERKIVATHPMWSVAIKLLLFFDRKTKSHLQDDIVCLFVCGWSLGRLRDDSVQPSPLAGH